MWRLRGLAAPARAEQTRNPSGNVGPECRHQAWRDVHVPPARPQRLAVDPGPGAGVRHQRADHRMIELVAAARGAIGREQGPARQREIADRVQDLVTDELVRKAQALRVEDAVVADDQRVLQRGAERVARIPQSGDIAHEAEGAGAGDLAAEAVGPQVERERLTPDQRVIELDFGFDAEAARIGPDFAVGIAQGNPYRLEHLDVAPRLLERLEPDLIDGGDERRRAAVHDRSFRPVDLDHGIVD